MRKKRLTAEQLYQKDYWEKNKEEILAKRKKPKLRRKLAKYARAYYLKNEQQLMAYQAKYRAKRKRERRKK